MLTQIMHGHLLIAIRIRSTVPHGVQPHGTHLLTWGQHVCVASERILDIGEQPWPALAAAANRNAGATGFGNHGKRIVRTQIAVAEHWNVKRFDQRQSGSSRNAVIFGGGTRVRSPPCSSSSGAIWPASQERFYARGRCRRDFSRHRHVGSIADLDHAG